MSPKLTLNLGLRYDVYRIMDQPNLEKIRLSGAEGDCSPYGRIPRPTPITLRHAGLAGMRAEMVKRSCGSATDVLPAAVHHAFLYQNLFQEPTSTSRRQP